jgi:TonB family protein
MIPTRFFLLCFATCVAFAGPLRGYPAAQASETPGDLYTRALAVLYAGGASPDYAAAAKLFRQAADRDLPAAQRALGELYLNGVGVAKSPAEAAKWFEKAAEAGDSWAQSSLGYLYSEGLGVGKDEQKAVAWLQRGIDAGDASAQFHMASLYARGFGVTRNPELAMEGYRKAADQRFALAQFALAIAYEVGFGGQRMSLDEAAYWYTRAAENGLEAAKAPLKVLAPDLAPPPSAPNAPAPQPQRVPLDVAGANLIESPQPSYPGAARTSRVQGAVILEAVINRLGRIRSLRLVQGEPLLNEAAMDAVRRWVYKHQLVDGQPVEVVTTITVKFSFQ